MGISTSDLQDAIEHQRASIAGEIHDSLFPFLFATRMRLDSLLDRLHHDQTRVDASLNNIGPVREEIAEAIESLKQAMTVGRHLIGELHPPELDTLTWTEQMMESVRRFGRDLEPSLTTEGDYDLFFTDHQHRIAARRIAQESISNAIRHGRASAVYVTVKDAGDDSVTLTISDNGRGFDPDNLSSNSYGLRIMKARVNSIGGKFALESKIGGPTRVSMICHR